jgi:hypothetical protein
MSTPNTQDTGKTAEQIWAEEAVQPTPPNQNVEAPSPAPAPAPAPAPSPAAAPAPAPSPAPSPAPAGDDPYAGLHPTIAQRLRGLDGLEQRLRKSEGTLGNLNSTLRTVQDENAKLKTALEQRATTAASGGAAPTAAAVAAAGKNSEKWDALKAEFPEWAEAVEERLGQAGQQQAPVDLDALRKQIGDELTASLTERLTPQIREQLQGETEERLVNVAHRGWKDTVKTPAFTEWMKAQTPEVQALGGSPVAEDAIALLDGFKSWQATQPAPVDPARVAAERKQRLQDAATVARGGSSQTPIRSTDDMSADELWAFEAAELDRKRRAQNQR